MATIQELKNLVSVNETQQGPSDRITGSEVRAVDNAIIDELAVRGVVQNATINDLVTASHTNSSTLIVPGEGLFYAIASATAPDNFNTFASADAGWLWQRVVAKATIFDIAFQNNMGTGFDAAVGAAKLQSTGKIIAIGSFNTINALPSKNVARLNADGTPDAAFGVNIGTGPNVAINIMIIQPDDKIILGGGFTSFNGVNVGRLCRLNPDGTMDTAFNNNITAVGFASFVYAATLHSNGRILLGGEFTTFNTVAHQGLMALNPDGTPDAAYNTNIGTGVGGSGIYNLTTGAGNISAGVGNFSGFNGAGVRYIVRLSADGSQDATFKTNAGVGFNGSTFGVGIQADGKIVVHAQNANLYNTTNIARVSRINADGTPDLAYDANLLLSPVDSFPYNMAIDSAGRVISTGPFTRFGTINAPSIARINPNGTIDLNFLAALGTGPVGGTVSDLALYADGRLLLNGTFTSFNGSPYKYLVRLNKL